MNTNRITNAVAKRVTFANVVASLALFIALGGVSYAAATLPAKSVGAKQLKTGAVTSAKLKNRGITGTDVKSNTLTGTQINESKLGVVPNATAADHAGTSAREITTYVTAVSSAANNDPNVARAAAKEIPLTSHGAIDIYGKCFVDTDDDRTYYEVIARTSQPGSILIGYSTDDDLDGNPSLHPTTLETDREVAGSWVSNNSSGYTYASAATVLGADGKGVVFDALVWARNGDPTDPPKTLPEGDSCAFQLAGIKNS